MKFSKAFILLITRNKQTISKDKKQSLVSKVALTLYLLSPSTLAQCYCNFDILPFFGHLTHLLLEVNQEI